VPSGGKKIRATTTQRCSNAILPDSPMPTAPRSRPPWCRRPARCRRLKELGEREQAPPSLVGGVGPARERPPGVGLAGESSVSAPNRPMRSARSGRIRRRLSSMLLSHRWPASAPASIRFLIRGRRLAWPFAIKNTGATCVLPARRQLSRPVELGDNSAANLHVSQRASPMLPNDPLIHRAAFCAARLAPASDRVPEPAHMPAPETSHPASALESEYEPAKPSIFPGLEPWPAWSAIESC